MAKSAKERQQALRTRRAKLGQKEMRGIWVTDAEEIKLKQHIKRELQKLREST